MTDKKHMENHDISSYCFLSDSSSEKLSCIKKKEKKLLHKNSYLRTIDSVEQGLK